MQIILNLLGIAMFVCMMAVALCMREPPQQ